MTVLRAPRDCRRQAACLRVAIWFVDRRGANRFRRRRTSGIAPIAMPANIAAPYAEGATSVPRREVEIEPWNMEVLLAAMCPRRYVKRSRSTRKAGSGP